MGASLLSPLTLCCPVILYYLILYYLSMGFFSCYKITGKAELGRPTRIIDSNS